MHADADDENGLPPSVTDSSSASIMRPRLESRPAIRIGADAGSTIRSARRTPRIGGHPYVAGSPPRRRSNALAANADCRAISIMQDHRRLPPWAGNMPITLFALHRDGVPSIGARFLPSPSAVALGREHSGSHSCRIVVRILQISARDDADQPNPFRSSAGDRGRAPHTQK